MPWPIPQPYPASDLSHSIAFHSVGTSVPLTAYKTDSAYSTCLELASRMEDVAQYHSLAPEPSSRIEQVTELLNPSHNSVPDWSRKQGHFDWTLTAGRLQIQCCP